VKREDFMFTVGFDGATAVVDGQLRRRYGHAPLSELLDNGLYRPAACAALWDDDEEAVRQVIDAFGRASGVTLAGRVDLVRLIGVPLQVLGPSRQSVKVQTL
jgi:spore coat protein U-like protein